MANRVVLGPLPGGGTGLRVSRPGGNVLNANLPGKQVAFDSRWLTGSRIITAGEEPIPNSDGTTTVNFGVTLPEIPVFMGMYRNSTSFGWPTDPNPNEVDKNVRIHRIAASIYNASELTQWFNPENDVAQIAVYNNRFVFRHGYIESVGWNQGEFFRYGTHICYIIMRAS